MFYDPKYKQYRHFQSVLERTVNVAMLFTLAYETIELCSCALVEAMMLHTLNAKSFYQKQKLRRNNKVNYL